MARTTRGSKTKDLAPDKRSADPGTTATPRPVRSKPARDNGATQAVLASASAGRRQPLLLPEGGLLAVTRRGIVGWARDPSAPVDPIDVVLFADGEEVGRARADRFDEDLVRARIGPGIPGFVTRLTTLPAGAYPIRLSLRDAQGVALGTDLAVERSEDLSIAVEPGALADFEGMLDGLYGGLLLGWVWDRATPGRPVAVELFDGGERVDRTIADIPRDDLKAASKGGGRCGFTFQLPAALLDGSQHSLRVRVADTQVELRGGPLSFGPSQAKAVFDELARLRQEVARLGALVQGLMAPEGEFQGRIVRTLADRIAALSDLQREMVERELDALRAIALRPQMILPASEPDPRPDTASPAAAARPG